MPSITHCDCGDVSHSSALAKVHYQMIQANLLVEWLALIGWVNIYLSTSSLRNYKVDAWQPSAVQCKDDYHTCLNTSFRYSRCNDSLYCICMTHATMRVSWCVSDKDVTLSLLHTASTCCNESELVSLSQGCHIVTIAHSKHMLQWGWVGVSQTRVSHCHLRFGITWLKYVLWCHLHMIIFW